MYKNINWFLDKKRNKIDKMSPKPIIMTWLDYESMKDELFIIDQKVEYLRKNYSKGGAGKLNQWFLSNDYDFCSITAERFIIDYLRSKNTQIKDNIISKGIDATLQNGDKTVGIEITSLNGFMIDWIFKERLFEILYLHKTLVDKTLRITYNPFGLIKKYSNNVKLFHQYITSVGDYIMNEDYLSLNNLSIKVEIEKRWNGCITWDIINKATFPWLRLLTEDLLKNITKSNKSKQLNKYPKNIIFVGINNVSPSNWAIPSLFEDIGRNDDIYSKQITHIRDFWQQELINYKNITGICYFNYSLNIQNPFYPLKVFWRNDNDKISINI